MCGMPAVSFPSKLFLAKNLLKTRSIKQIAKSKPKNIKGARELNNTNPPTIHRIVSISPSAQILSHKGFKSEKTSSTIVNSQTLPNKKHKVIAQPKPK